MTACQEEPAAPSDENDSRLQNQRFKLLSKHSMWTNLLLLFPRSENMNFVLDTLFLSRKQIVPIALCDAT